MTEIHEKKDMGSTYNKIRFPKASIHLRPSDEDSPKSFEDSLEYISDVLGATGVGDGDGFFSSASSSFTASSLFVSRSITEQTKIHYHSTSK